MIYQAFVLPALAAPSLEVHGALVRISLGRIIPAICGAALLVAGCDTGAKTGTTATSASTAVPAPVSSQAQDLQSQFVRVVDAVAPSVVLISTDKGLGSGIIYDQQGDILTNNHVIAGASSLGVALSSGKQYPATLVGAFAVDDVAVIRIQAGGLKPAAFGNSSALVVGDFVMAVGNPLGLQSSVTEGIVSALGRTVAEPGGSALPGVIQTSAAINPGNSGGALVNLSGQVVGMPTLVATDPQLGGSAPGIGFAISSNMARNIAGQLIQYGHVVNSQRAYLGVSVADLGGGQGVVIASVFGGGPAATAGLQPGDVITGINGTAVTSADGLATLLASLKPGDTVSVDIVRPDGSKQTIMVRLGQLPG